MSTTKAGHYGRWKKIDPATGTNRCDFFTARGWTLVPTAANVIAKLTDARLFPYTGYGHMMIVNLAETGSGFTLDIQDATGSTITLVDRVGTTKTRLDPQELVFLSLLENDTEGGTWFARFAAVNVAGAPPPNFILEAGHPGLGGGQDAETATFDPDDDSWTQRADRPKTVVSDPTSFQISGTGYSHGGNAADRVEIYSYAANVWSAHSDLPDSTNTQNGHSSGEAGGFGVCYHAGSGEVEEFDGSTWTSKATAQSAAQSTAAELANGLIYFCLDADPSNPPTDRFRSFDRVLNSFTVLADYPLPGLRQHAAAVWSMETDKIDRCGGNEGGATIFDEHDQYSVGLDSWATKQPSSLKNNANGAMRNSSNTDFAYIGGGTWDASTNRTERYSLIGNSWTNVNGSPTYASNRQHNNWAQTSRF